MSVLADLVMSVLWWPSGGEGVVAHLTAGIVLQGDVSIQQHGRHGQGEAEEPGHPHDNQGAVLGHHHVLVQRPEDRDAPFHREQEDGKDRDKGAPSEDRPYEVAGSEAPWFCVPGGSHQIGRAHV